MQLILAIDGDRKQAEQLASLVRGRLGAELVQATSAGEGLQLLGERVPDLIMTAPLLSPFDDGVLAEYLRDLGAAAAHVQTLRIPVLSPPRTPSVRSLFSLRRKRVAAPDGCDPTVFADEIAVYLARAAEERQGTAVDTAPLSDATVATDAEIESSERREHIADEPPERHGADLVPVGAMAAVTADVLDEEERRDPDPVPAVVPPAPPPERTSSFEAALAAIRAAWDRPDTTIPVIAPHTIDEHEAAPSDVEAVRPEHHQRRHADWTAGSGEVAAASVREEWSAFDPERCGFSTLVDKLDEVTDRATRKPVEPAPVPVVSLR